MTAWSRKDALYWQGRTTAAGGDALDAVYDQVRILNVQEALRIKLLIYINAKERCS